MGYTHYWKIDLSKANHANYSKAINVIRKIVNDNSRILANGMGDRGTKPETEKEISFNGIDREGHETFYLPLTLTKEVYMSNFCKTAFKKYDKIVTACLSVLDHYCHDFITVSSDGEDEDWQDGKKIAYSYINNEG